MTQHEQLAMTDEQLDLFEKRLTGLLYRVECPPAQQLRDLYHQLLSVDTQTELAAHVALCPLCAEELGQIRHFAELTQATIATAPPEITTATQKKPAFGFADPWRATGDQLRQLANNAAEKVQFVVATLISGLTPLQPVGVALRGEEQSLVYTLPGDNLISVAITCHSVVEASLSGQILTTDPATAPQRFQLIGQDPSAGVRTGEIDSFGHFAAERLAVGHYQLILEGGAQPILVPDLTIG